MFKGFQKPKRLVANTETLTERYGSSPPSRSSAASAPPSATACAACCSSSIEGAAITAVRIEGVEHEFSPIPGVVEDATDIILNLKQIPFKIMGEGIKTVRLTVDQAGRSAAAARSRPTPTWKCSTATCTSPRSAKAASSTSKCA